MPAYNFTVFLDKVADGTKCQTVRKERTPPTRPGQRFYGYTGQRTKSCRKLTEGPITAVKPVQIDAQGLLWIDHTLQCTLAYEMFARDDGFADRSAFLEFFRSHYGLPFVGEVVMWEPEGDAQ